MKDLYSALGEYPEFPAEQETIVNGQDIIPLINAPGMIQAFELHTTTACKVEINGYTMSTRRQSEEDYVLVVSRRLINPQVSRGSGVASLKIFGSGHYYIQYYC